MAVRVDEIHRVTHVSGAVSIGVLLTEVDDVRAVIDLIADPVKIEVAWRMQVEVGPGAIPVIVPLKNSPHRSDPKIDRYMRDVGAGDGIGNNVLVVHAEDRMLRDHPIVTGIPASPR